MTSRTIVPGTRFGHLVAISKNGKHRGNTLWLCKCDCGVQKTICGRSLVRGRSKSCGHTTRKHGMSNSRTYIAWVHMKGRCYNPNNSDWARYGARGISVCDRWRESFANFLADMGECPDGLSIERKDYNGNYCPENCKWATTKEQGRNTSHCRRIAFNGETATMIEWSERVGISYYVLRARLRLGWESTDALTTPVMRRGRQKHLIPSH